MVGSYLRETRTSYTFDGQGVRFDRSAVSQMHRAAWRCACSMYLVFFLPRCFRQGAAPVRSDLEHRRIDAQILAVSTSCKTEPLCWKENCMISVAGATQKVRLRRQSMYLLLALYLTYFPCSESSDCESI